MVDKQPTKDSKCPHCVPHGTKLWLRIGCDCKTCNGTGKVTESKPDESQEDLGLFKYDSDTGWYECPRCHYSQIRLVGFCMKCGYDVFKPSKGNLDNSKELPMGVTEWKQHGIKYGYWDYFKEASEQEKANEEIIKSMKSSKADNTKRFYGEGILKAAQPEIEEQDAIRQSKIIKEQLKYCPDCGENHQNFLPVKGHPAPHSSMGAEHFVGDGCVPETLSNPTTSGEDTPTMSKESDLQADSRKKIEQILGYHWNEGLEAYTMSVDKTLAVNPEQEVHQILALLESEYQRGYDAGKKE